jgi:hypothetical protein
LSSSFSFSSLLLEAGSRGDTGRDRRCVLERDDDVREGECLEVFERVWVRVGERERENERERE